MVIHQSGTTKPRNGEKVMTDTCYVSESKRRVRKLAEVYDVETLTRRLEISPGAFQNLWRGRLKTISVDLYMRLCDAAEAEMRREIGHLHHEITVIAKTTRRHSRSKMETMAAQLKAMKKTLEDSK